MGFVGFFSIGGSGSAPLDYARIRIGVVGRMARRFSETTILQYVVENPPALSSMRASSITCDWSRNPRENRSRCYLIVHAYDDLTRVSDIASHITEQPPPGRRWVRQSAESPTPRNPEKTGILMSLAIAP
jgi:hypothetical protein